MAEQTVSHRVAGRFWYWIAGVLFLVSVVAPAPVVLWQVFGRGEEAPRLIAPETKILPLARGTYTIFSDSRAVIDGEILISQGSIAGLRVIVRGEDGKSIPVEAVSVPSRYNTGGQVGFSILQFSVPASGNYTITAEYREKAPNQRALLSIRKDYLGGLFGTIMLAIFGSLIGCLLSVWIFLRTLWRRRALVAEGIRVNIRNMGESVKQAARQQRYSPPGSSDTVSPVEHTYDRNK